MDYADKITEIEATELPGLITVKRRIYIKLYSFYTTAMDQRYRNKDLGNSEDNSKDIGNSKGNSEGINNCKGNSRLLF